MSREIKFRGKRIDNGEWVYGYLVKNQSGQCRIYYQPFEEATMNTYHFVQPSSVGEFTGLRDKNGKEIYEGDVLSDNGYKYRPVELKEVVLCTDTWGLSYTAKCWCAQYFDKSGYAAIVSAEESYSLNVNRSEIIGNIYEHPHLLNPSTPTP